MEKASQDNMVKAIGTILVLVVSGGTGYGTASVSIKYLEKKIDAVELTVNQNKRDSEKTITNLSDKISDIRDDVSYIRGAIDGAKVK